MKKESNYKKLMNYAGKYKYLSYLSIILSAISGVLAVIPFIYIWKIIKEVIEVMPNFNEATNIVSNGWMAVLFALLTMLVYFCGLMCSHLSAFRVVSNIRIKLMEHITKMPIGIINDFGSGKLRKIVTGASTDMETYLAHNLPDMVTSIITPIVMIVFLFIFDWRLGLVSLIPIVIGFAAMMKMIGPQMAKDTKKYQDALEDMNNEAVEYVRGIPIVKTFSQTVFSFKRFKKSIDDYNKFCIFYSEKARGPMITFQVVTNSIFAFLISITLIIVGNGTIELNFFMNLLFYIIFTPLVTTTFSKIAFMGENTMIVSDGINRINSILNIEPLKNPETSKVTKSNEIDLKNVKFKYDGKDDYAINGISLKIPKNKMIALVGPSGSGKSTLANLISRFYDVTEGEILVGGVNIKDLTEKDLMNKISFVFQDSKLLKTTILENIKMAKPKATRKEISDAIKKACCEDIIEKLPNGIDTVIGSKGIYLSGGEVQRLCVARAILEDSPILILDEAAAFVDPDNEEKIQKSFEKLARNKTIIMIAHRISTVKNADVIYVLKDGKIEEFGKHEDLMKSNGTYLKMWNDYQTSISWKVGKKNA